MIKLGFFKGMFFAVAITASVAVFGMELRVKELEVRFSNPKKNDSDGRLCIVEITCHKDLSELCVTDRLPRIFPQSMIDTESFYVTVQDREKKDIKIKYINAAIENAAIEQRNEFENLFVRRSSVDNLGSDREKIEPKGNISLFDQIFTIQRVLGFGAFAATIFVFLKWDYVKALMRF